MTRNVLIVEDDPVQLEWAKQELAKFTPKVKVLYVSSRAEVTKLLDEKSDFDFVLQDLEIPNVAGKEPEWKIGKNLFETLVWHYATDKIRGIALVSNYEHHCHSNKGLRDLDLFPLDILSHVKELDRGKVNFRKGKINIIIWHDVNLSQYPFYVMRGKITPNHGRPYDLEEPKKLTFLKPWREILEALIKFSGK